MTWVRFLVRLNVPEGQQLPSRDRIQVAIGSLSNLDEINIIQLPNRRVTI